MKIAQHLALLLVCDVHVTANDKSVTMHTGWSAILWGNCNATAAGLNGFCSLEQKIDTPAG